jgi:hypothetical protein
MTQITDYKPLEDGNSKSDVRSCPKKNHNHIDYFYVEMGYCYTGKIRFLPHFGFFCPICNFYTPKLTNLTENVTQLYKNVIFY